MDAESFATHKARKKYFVAERKGGSEAETGEFRGANSRETYFASTSPRGRRRGIRATRSSAEETEEPRTRASVSDYFVEAGTRGFFFFLMYT